MRDSVSTAERCSRVQLFLAAAGHAEILIASYGAKMAYEIAQTNAAIERSGKYWFCVFRAVREFSQRAGRV
jgi:hypothetical protein